ncbi:MAG: hypothetical protein M3R02_09740, partial [Chloroflexota bacterium]|nr:hypothetical protein [Chloroflexota bacterium]
GPERLGVGVGIDAVPSKDRGHVGRPDRVHPHRSQNFHHGTEASAAGEDLVAPGFLFAGLPGFLALSSLGVGNVKGHRARHHGVRKFFGKVQNHLGLGKPRLAYANFLRRLDLSRFIRHE